ncbi:MAG: potassium channel protein [Pseudanabaenaceae cyanobacterium SKYGB_i_bin29]|nr:potassium channel protein [Pseudanabaenaceae cyanobacterium SKYG29]MDW8421871.1 potassium channel protein [Pseudanabaenaceae cyanobacterium SKYGB_i_bin29]
MTEQLTLSRRFQDLRRDLIGGVVAFIALGVVGVLGYRFLEGWGWLDAIYMTVITLSTVGFGEIHPLQPDGRIFTIGLILSGIVTVGYMVNRVSEAVIQGYFKEIVKMRQQRQVIGKLDRHYILCGYGRTGKQVALEFAAEGIPFIVVDQNPDALRVAEENGYLTLLADATLDETLIKVGIDRAVCIVASLPSDAENLYTVLSAKSLNPKIRAVARASTEEAMQKLRRGGADEVISPYITGGKRMAAAALRPQVMDFVDGIISGTNRSFYIEEYVLDARLCSFVGQSLIQTRFRSRTGALVLAIRRVDGELIAGPSGETILQDGDRLICMGTADQLRQLNQLLSNPNTEELRPPRQAGEEEE